MMTTSRKVLLLLVLVGSAALLVSAEEAATADAGGAADGAGGDNDAGGDDDAAGDHGGDDDTGEDHAGDDRYDAGDYGGMGGGGGMDWGSLAGAAGQLLGGGGGGMGGMGGLASMLGPAAAALMGGGMGGGGGGGGMDLASMAAAAAPIVAPLAAKMMQGGMQGDGQGGIDFGSMASSFMQNGGGEMLGNMASNAGMSEIGDIIKDIDGDTVRQAANVATDAFKGGAGGMEKMTKEGGAIDKLFTKLTPVMDKVKTAFEKGGKRQLLKYISKHLEIDVSTAKEGEIQKAILTKVLDPKHFKTAALKVYRLFVLPTTAATIQRDEEDSKMVKETIESLEEVSAGVLSEDAGKRDTEIIQGREYTSEEHELRTSDKYKLTMFRIPHGKEEKPPATPRPVVFLMHALTASSTSWIAGRTEGSLAYYLADQGYDVWLGNARGNGYSKFHPELTPASPKFWNWTWDQIATIDVPEMIAYVLQKTGQSQLNYVGHSQGATVGMAAFSRDPNLASKIKHFAALAPVVSGLQGSSSLLVNSFKDIQTEQGWISELKSHEVFPLSKINTLIAGGCTLAADVCKKILNKVAGGAEGNIDTVSLSSHLAHLPSGTSAKNIAHWMQMTEATQLEAFKAPDGSGGQPYPVQQLQIPLAVYYGGDDALVPSAMVENFLGGYGNKVDQRKIDSYGHMDFIWGLNANKEVNYHVATSMAVRNGLQPPAEVPVPLEQLVEEEAPEEGEEEDKEDGDEDEVEPGEEPPAAPESPKAAATQTPKTEAATVEAGNTGSPEDCKSWAEAGECANNAVYMKQNCAQACENHFGTCKNNSPDADCESWAKDNQCDANKEFMHGSCAKSCGLCQWGDLTPPPAEPEPAAPAAAETPPEPAAPPCADEHNDCAQWAKDGECKANAEYMEEACPKSCGKCQ